MWGPQIWALWGLQGSLEPTRRALTAPRCETPPHQHTNAHETAVELRGGARNVKVATKKAQVSGTAILWNETLTL